ncbi:alpha/beta fold hydrolase [Enterovirga aerilata]|uniref:Alpha/beta hydrolase n=1 Tax=Enterovirga aerilata TaxID=2730920 RepID=A0A849I5R4_9HYPH|nr:alpha/beta hydrolase [Enterovirga sp. DB1703]NNM75206.1 alpha/beta hydrolase [Enterovirga sp. DB1703]
MTKRSFRDVWTRSSDGLRLHARSYGDDRATALPVVCLPGLARHAGDFHDLAMALTDPEEEPPRHVVAIDYRGRGQSDHDRDPDNYAVPVETADLLAVLAELEIPRAIFVGTSRGGIITMGLAAARPEMVAGAVLVDIGPVIERAGLLRIKGYVGKLGQPRDLDEAAGMLEGLFGGQFPNLRDRDWQTWARSTWEEKAGRLVLTYDPALARTLEPIGPQSEIPDLWAAFDGLRKAPVLVIRGALSDLLSEDTVREMRARHPDLDLVTVPDQGHTPLLRGDDIIGAIRRFVEHAEARAAARA